MADQNNISLQWDQYADLYDDAQGENGDPAHQLLFDPAIERLLGDLHDKSVLDAGSGNGYWARRLAKKAKEVVGIDASPDLVEIARRKDNPANVEFQVMDLLNPLDFSDQRFDVILSSMVLHYISVLDIFAEECNRVLKNRGELVICVQHPIYQYHYRVQEKAGKGNKIFPKTIGYFDKEPIEQITLFGKAVLKIFNRSIADYINAFLHQGFVLTGIEEPQLTQELIDKNPRYEEIKEIPRVIILRFRKE